MKQPFRQSASRSFTSPLLCGIFLTAIVACLLVMPPSASMMATFNVNSVLDTVDAVPGNGVCADASGNCTLRAAVMEANALAGADIINVPAGTYTLTLPAVPLTYDQERLLSTGARQTGGDLDILSGDLTIIGASPTTTIIQAGATTATGIDRIFDINNPKGGPGIGIDVTLQNLTLRNGNSPTEPPTNFRHGGGAIQFDGFNLATGLPKGKLTIRNCVITANQAASTGGAIKVAFGSLDIDGSVITSNTSQFAAGGGVMYDGGSQIANQSLSITNTTISGNSAPDATFGSGGGVFASGNASFFFENNTFLNNSAGADGGAIAAVGFAAGKTKTINKNRIENNSALRGDGVFSSNSTASVSPLTFTLNVVVGNGSTSADTGLFSTTNTGGDLVANNWWGCNQGPNLDSCDRIGGAVGFGSGPWLVLNHFATPNPILVNASTTLQADFFTPSSGPALTATDLVALNGRAIVFNNAVLGTISGADTQISGGKANATFTAGPVGGTGSADATVDHAIVTVFIQISEPAAVSTNPTDQTACAGSSVSFTASATGFPTPTVQWQVSSGGPFTDIPGATSTTLTFTATAADNGKQYRAVFTNSGGTATTTAATLTVNTAPTVSTNPVNQAVCEGGTATFTAAASGSPSPTVQWQVSSGGPFTDIPGATNTTLSFTATAADNGKQYRAVFSNTCGTATTTAATLTINANTAATPLANQTKCQGQTANFSTTASGTGPFTYQWKLDGSNISGATNSSVAINTTSLSIGNHSVDVVVSGACNSVTKSATLTVNANTTTTDPPDKSVCEGTSASFSTTASGTGPFTFVWKKGVTVLNNGDLGGRVVIVNGASSSTLTINNTQASDAGTYSVETTGACNTAIQSATLSVNSSPPTITLNGQNISLWPPNHNYHPVNVTDLVASASSCDGSVNINSVVIDKVTSDEAENGNGDGNTSNDIVIACNRKSVQLRSERDGSGDGRVYTIYFKVTDGLGHSTTVTAKVTVPKNQNGSAAVDSGPHYTVTNATCP